MGFNPVVAEKLVRFFFPIMFAWFYLGLVIAVLYHLSLYYLDGEFQDKEMWSLNMFVSVLRGILYVFVWPAIFYFDRSAAHRIKLFLLYLSPKQRAENQELKDALSARKYRNWVKGWFLAKERIEKRRKKELETWQEHESRARVLHEGNPELDRIWMLTGVGTHPAGVRELVRLCPDYYLVEEVTAMAKREIELRRPWNCLRCRTQVRPEQIRIPGLTFLRVIEPETRKMVVEGWALHGTYTMTFEQCPSCGAEQPDLTEDLAGFGHASDVVRFMRDGLTYHWDLP